MGFKISKRKIYNILDYIVLILVILLSGTMYSQVDLNFMPVNLVLLVCYVLLVVVSLGRIKRISKKLLIWVLFVVGALIIYSCYNFRYIYDGFKYFFVPVIIFSVYMWVLKQNGEIENECRRIVNVVCIMAVVSLVFYCLINYLGILSPTAYYKPEWRFIPSVPSYYDIYFEPMPVGRIMGFSIVKNCAIYPEAPMFSFILCIALLLEVCCLNSNKFKICILTIAIITTGSTTGYIVLIALCALKFAGFVMNNTRGTSIKVMIWLAAILIGGTTVVLVYADKVTTVSYGTRMDHVNATLTALIKSNFMGVGIANHSAILEYAVNKQGLSVGLLTLFAECGIIALFLMGYPVLKCIRRNSWDKNIMIISFLFLIFTTYVVYQLQCWFFYSLFIVVAMMHKEDNV